MKALGLYLQALDFLILTVIRLPVIVFLIFYQSLIFLIMTGDCIYISIDPFIFNACIITELAQGC